jgi:N-acetylglutamate synthase-like GNAT family acetyltransferase
LMYDLRWRILREPWGQPRGSEKDPGEEQDFHLIALLNDEIIGTVRYHALNDVVAQVRNLAVEEKYRRKGVAHNLMESLEMTGKNQGFKYFVLNAREIAKEFYKKIGYAVMGDGPLLYDVIVHFKMMKKLGKGDSKIRNVMDELKKMF